MKNIDSNSAPIPTFSYQCYVETKFEISQNENRSAQQHAEEMAGTAASGSFSHFSHEGAMERFERTGLACINCAENLARVHGHDDIPVAVVNGWIDSPGHRRNLVGPFNVCGIGVSTNGEGVTFVSQLYISFFI